MKYSARLIDLDSVMIDVMMRVESLPGRGSDTLALEHLVATGGGFNVMSAAARHGMKCVYAGQLGTGPFATIARASLKKERIMAPVVADPDCDLGCCLVLVDAQGERTFVTSKGAELRLRAYDLDGLDVASGDYVYVSGYNVLYPEVSATVTAWLEQLANDVVVAFDPGVRVMDIPTSALRPVLARTDWLLCSAREGMDLSGEGSLMKAADALLAMTGRRGVVVHDGADGCAVATREHRAQRVAGFPVDVVDTNGAGDTHNGVFLAEVAHGRDVLKAARWANAAAAMSVGTLGPATCPKRDVVSSWISRFEQ